MNTASSNNCKNNILFIGPETFQYHHTLIQVMRQQSISVTFMGENNLDIKFRIARFVGESSLDRFLAKWWARIETEIADRHFDQVLVIRGEMLRPEMLKKLRNRLATAEFIMYQWDSLSNHPYLPFVPFFDKVMTFDRKDADMHDFDYLPLFYDFDFEQIQNESVEQTIDVLMVGSLHNDRLSIAKQIRRQINDTGLNGFFFLYSPPLTFIKKGLTARSFGYDRNMVKFHSMPKKEYLSLLARTKIVLDINAPQQCGLTMRTIETLGAGRKLMTCNDYIRQDSFYSPEWIHVFNRNKPQIDNSFLAPYCGVPKVKKLRIDRWLKTLLEQ